MSYQDQINQMYYGGTGLMNTGPARGPLQADPAFMELQRQAAAQNPTGQVNVMPTVAGQSLNQARNFPGTGPFPGKGGGLSMLQQNANGIVPDFVSGNRPADAPVGSPQPPQGGIVPDFVSGNRPANAPIPGAPGEMQQGGSGIRNSGSGNRQEILQMLAGLLGWGQGGTQQGGIVPDFVSGNRPANATTGIVPDFVSGNRPANAPIPTQQFNHGQTYVDGNGNKAVFNNGQWQVI